MTDLARHESEFLLYAAQDGAVKVRVLFRDETAWLTQRGLAELFGVHVPAIIKHLKNIFQSGELERTATTSKMEIVASEGGREVIRNVEFYNLDAVIAVGYRVNSYDSSRTRVRLPFMALRLRRFYPRICELACGPQSLRERLRSSVRRTALGRKTPSAFARR